MLLVTGGAGYVGSHFVKEYLEAYPSKSLVVVDNLTEGHLKALQAIGYPDRLKFVEADIAEQATIKAVLRDYCIDAVVHFSAFAYVGDSSSDPLKYYNNNVVKSIALFEAMEAENVRKIVFSSTCATYGNPLELPLLEHHPLEPVNVYGETKLMVEKILQALHTYKNWSCVPLRYFNAVGASLDQQIGESHTPETHLIPLILQAAKGVRSSISILGNDYNTPDGTCVRDYIHVKDLAKAHLRALDHVMAQQVFLPVNLGTTQGTSVREVIDLCKKVTGKDFHVEIEPRRIGDPPILVANAKRAKEVLGWQPEYSLERSIESAWQWEMNRQY